MPTCHSGPKQWMDHLGVEMSESKLGITRIPEDAWKCHHSASTCTYNNGILGECGPAVDYLTRALKIEAPLPDTRPC